jgi:hypothetical protein
MACGESRLLGQFGRTLLPISSTATFCVFLRAIDFRRSHHAQVYKRPFVAEPERPADPRHAESICGRLTIRARHSRRTAALLTWAHRIRASGKCRHP